VNGRDLINKIIFYKFLNFDFQITFGRKGFSHNFDFDCDKDWDDFFLHTQTHLESC